VRVVLGGVRKLGQEVRELVLEDVLQRQQDADGADFCAGVKAGTEAVVEALAAAVGQTVRPALAVGPALVGLEEVASRRPCGRCRPMSTSDVDDTVCHGPERRSAAWADHRAHVGTSTGAPTVSRQEDVHSAVSTQDPLVTTSSTSMSMARRGTTYRLRIFTAGNSPARIAR